MRRFSWLGLFVTGAMGVAAAGCAVTVEPPTDPGGVEPGETQIQVRLQNRTDQGVNVELFATSTPLVAVGDAQTVLFAPGNQILGGIGFLGTGLMDKHSEDTVTLACENAEAIGTLGGRFLDDEGIETGAGKQVVLIKGLNYDCGATITLVWRNTGSGYETLHAVE